MSYGLLLVETQADREWLATRVGLTTAELEEAIAELARAGVALERSSAPTGHYVLPPEQAFEVLIAREEERLDAERAALRATRDEVPALVSEYVNRRAVGSAEEVEFLADSPLVRSRLFQLTSEATRSVWATHVGPAASHEAVRAALPLDRATTERGLEQRMLIDLDSLGPAHWTTYLETLLDLGHELRVLPAVPQLMLIFDEQHCLVPGAVVDGSTSAFVLHGPHLCRPITVLFNELWDSATPYGEQGGRADTAFTEVRLRQLASLLARGLKDEAIARRLGVSVRTVRRMVSALSDELHAASRFQAGFLAATRGWADGPRSGADSSASGD